MRTDKRYPNLFLLDDHTLIGHSLTRMRNKDTPPELFRRHLGIIAMLMGYEVTRELPHRDEPVETSLATISGVVVNEADIALISVLRAGLGMAEGLRALLPGAKEGHIGLYRDPKTTRPVEYYTRLPDPETPLFIVVDPMVATGYSATCAVDTLNRAGVGDDRIRFMGLIAAPEGVRVFHQEHPSLPLYVAALDDHLNDHAYIVPGLGDAGDRMFGTR